MVKNGGDVGWVGGEIGGGWLRGLETMRRERKGEGWDKLGPPKIYIENR